MGYGIPRQVVLDGIGKEAEVAMENKSVSSIPTWFLLRFLPPGSCSEFSCGWIASTKVQTIVSFSHCLWMWCLITALEIQLVPRERSVREGVANLEERFPGDCLWIGRYQAYLVLKAGLLGESARKRSVSPLWA